MITVWCITDDKPGHKNQLKGLLQAMAERTALDFYWLSINDRRNWQNLPAPTLIIAAGSHTHLAALKLRWRHGGKLVVMMKPWLPQYLFDLCLIPQHDGASDSQRVITTAGAINSVPWSSQSDPYAGLILIGGPSKHYGWSDAKTIEQIFAIVSMTDTDADIAWQLTTSRRTPKSFLPALGTAVCSRGKPLKLSVVPFEKTDSNWLIDRYEHCGEIWVTEDSVSMVYESLSSGAKTGIIQVPRLQANRVSAGLDQLITEGRIMQGYQARMQHNAQTAKQLPPLREADRVAAEVIKRLL